ncbi:MAG: UDP-4-amino-4,6-dideoxy-N-acetyl-beta-L-altrosamine transaminase [bacterium]
MDPFIPYGKQWIEDEDIQAVVDVLKGDFLTQGPKIEEFEKALCDYTGAKYSVAVSNGTAALHIAVLALGLEPGSEGIASPNTFVASANCLAYAGLTPVFADIDPATYTLDPQETAKKVTPKTKVLIPVDFAGQPADMEAFSEMAKQHGLKVIEDAAHAIGTVYKNGKKVGSGCYSDMTIFSFHPVKTITTGEGGAVLTNDPELYKKLTLLRSHGITKREEDLTEHPGPWYYEMQSLGFNYRLTDLQAALGVVQMGKIEKFLSHRRSVVDRYNQAFASVPLLTIPQEREGASSAFHLYVLQIDFEALGLSRAEVMGRLKAKGVGTQVHYIPVHLQPYYRETYGYKEGDFPRAEEYYSRCLSLPLYPKMQDEEIERVIAAVKEMATGASHE